MQDFAWRAGLTLTVLAALAIVGLGAGCMPAHQLAEQVLGQTPQAQIAAYLAAIARGDEQEALALWPAAESPGDVLNARRRVVADDLLAYGPLLEHRILDIVWWRTCCEPAVIDDPAAAGGARVRVAVRGGDRSGVYLFDLLVPGGYWGSAAGDPIREWKLVDIYPDGETALVWTWEE